MLYYYLQQLTHDWDRWILYSPLSVEESAGFHNGFIKASLTVLVVEINAFLHYLQLLLPALHALAGVFVTEVKGKNPHVLRLASTFRFSHSDLDNQCKFFWTCYSVIHLLLELSLPLRVYYTLWNIDIWLYG